MPKRTHPQAPSKPAKPYPDFPLFPHATKRWAKKIRGRLVYFGPWSDPQAALVRYNEQRDDLHAGRKPRQDGDGCTIRDLCNRYLTAKQRQVDAGDLKFKTFSDYRKVTDRIVETFGATRLVSDLRPDDFGRLRAVIADKRGPTSVAGQIVQSKMVFTFAYANELIDQPVRYGSLFSRPAQKELRKVRNRREKVQLYGPGEIATLIEAATVPMRAMILLGINCGFGNTDIAELPQSAIDFKQSVLDFPRPKTGIARRCPLWPETVKALREAIDARPSPKSAADRGLVFLTTAGNAWVRVLRKLNPTKGQTAATLVDSVNREFSKLQKSAGTCRTGRGFYSLRHTFRTVADELPDRPAIDRVMGHENTSDMRTHYVARIDDGRLRVVSDHVRGWFFGHR